MSGIWQPSPDELKSYVFKGIWKRYDKQRLTWTLSNFSALIVVAWLSCLIALAQSQCWSLVRYIIAQETKPVRLEGDDTLDPLLKLSQSQAVESVIPLLSGWTVWLFNRTLGFFRIESRRQAGSSRPPDNDPAESPDNDPVESPFFGLATILNISFFLVMQFLIPYWLTEGILGTPIVKSRLTDECRNSRPDHLWDKLNRETRADEIFHLCRDVLNAGCDSPYYLSEPKITKTRPTTCPFSGDICLNDTASFQITHWNISAFEIGVNSRSKLLVNHRLTYTPVSLDPFLYQLDDRSMIYILRSFPDGPGFTLFNNVSLILATKNGPNKFSNESSGLKMFEEKGSFGLTVLPRLMTTKTFLRDRPSFELNKALQRDDGESFLIVYRAGDRHYSEMINDPFFSAHNKGFPSTDYFCADAEATALGCVEQFQYCFSPRLSQPCTDWGAHVSQVSVMLKYLQRQYKGPYRDNVNAMAEHWNDQLGLSFNEMFASLAAVPGSFGVYDYLTLRIDMNQMVPLIQRKSVSTQLRWTDDASEQWVLKVETWFMKAWLSGLLTIQDGALYMLTGIGPGFSDKYLREWLLCSRILFHNQDFTNLNWIGFWASTACLTLLCLTGSYIGAIYGVLKGASHVLKKWKMRRRISSFWGKLSNWRIPANNAEWFINLPGTVWNITFLFQSFSRRRPWYGGGSGGDSGGDSGGGSSSSSGGSGPNVAASDRAEMDDLEPPPSIALGGDGHGIGDTEDEFWHIDDPI